MKHSGLTNKEVSKRLVKYGKNKITAPRKFIILKIFFRQIRSPLIYILLLAAIFSGFLGEPRDAIFILAVVIINISLGFFQEFKAENTFKALQKNISKKVKVIRESERVLVDSTEVVPGDLIVLEPGLRVPADALILEVSELLVNEALLTGESEPQVKKEVKAKAKTQPGDDYKVYKGTLVVQGIGIAEVKETGDSTEFGKIAKSLHENLEPNTPTRKRLDSIGKLVTTFVIVVSISVVFLGIAKGLEPDEVLFTAVALGISTIPEGLIIAYTITLVLGMQRIMSKKSVVKNLHAAETLGSIDVLCIDKTGTITLGEMQVNGVDVNDHDLSLKTLALCNNDANFVDEALKEMVISEASDSYFNQMQDERKKFFPFSSNLKYTGASDKTHLYAVGAPEVIFGFSKNVSKKWQKEVTKKAKKGNRMIGIAYKKLGDVKTSREDFKDMKFLGLVFIKDPVRTSAKESLEEIKNSHIDIKIITGDLKETSLNVLDSLNFEIENDETISGLKLSEIKEEKKFDQAVKKTKLFYRTSPDQKLSIVKSLQRQGKKVAMMGDGVNDSPAIKRAEIGIVVDSATDVSKEVADLILLDSNFQTIVDATEEGRNIFKNLRKILVYLFADSLSETILILAALFSGLPLPLTPLHLLWINIIEDGLPSLALSFDKSSHNLLKKKVGTNILDKNTLISIAAISIVTDVLYFLLYRYMLDNGYSLETARTMMFAGISITSLVFLYSAKTVDTNIWKENIFNNKVVNISVLIGFLLVGLSVYWAPLQVLLGNTSLHLLEVLFLIGISLFDVLAVEVVKLVSRRKV